MAECGGANRKKASVAVIGGGLVGPIQAILLAQKGLTVDLYEARRDIRRIQPVGGRSINLEVNGRGRDTLRAVGLEDIVLESAIPMKGLMIHSLSGKMFAQPFGRKDQCVYSINRLKLNELLLTKAEAKYGVSVHFEHKLTRANLEEKTLVLYTCTCTLLRNTQILIPNSQEIQDCLNTKPKSHINLTRTKVQIQ